MRTSVVTVRRHLSSVHVVPLSYWPLPQATPSGGAEIGPRPCQATVTRYSLLPMSSTQPRPPITVPSLLLP